MAEAAVTDAIYKLTYRADGDAEVEALRGSVERLTDSTAKQEVTQERVTRATRTTTGEYNRMMARLDPRIRAEQQLGRALEQTARLLNEGAISSSQSETAIAAATTRYDEAMGRLRNSIDPVTRSQSAMEQATRSLDSAVARGVITQEEANRVLAMAREKLDAAADETEDFGRRSDEASGGVDRLSAGIRKAAGLLATLGLALGVRQIINYADAWTDLNSRLRLTVGSAEAAGEVMERLSEIARRTYSSLELTAETFLRNNSVLRELGYTTQQTLDFTEALNNALVVSGAKGAVAATIQDNLTKAMAFGELRGENLNTVLERGEEVTRLLARELGVGTNELRRLGEEGRITGDVIASALIGNLDELREKADSMPATVGDAFTLMGNAVMQFIGQLEETTGIFSMIAQAIILVADNIWILVTALGVLAARFALVSGGLGLILTTAAGAAVLVNNMLNNWFRRTEDNTEVLQEHVRIVEEARRAYQEVGGAVEEWGAALRQVSLDQVQANLDSMLTLLDQVTDRIQREVAGMSTFISPERFSAEAQVMIGSMQSLIDLFAEGEIQSEAFKLAVSGIAEVAARNLGPMEGEVAATARALLNLADGADAAEERVREALMAMYPFRDSMSDAQRAAYDLKLELYGVDAAAMAAAGGIGSASGAASAAVGSFSAAAGAARDYARALAAIGSVVVQRQSPREQVAGALEDALQAADRLGLNNPYYGWMRGVQAVEAAERELTEIVAQEAAERTEIITRETSTAVLNQLEGIERARAAEQLRYEEMRAGLVALNATQDELNALDQLHLMNLEAINAQYAEMGGGGGGGGRGGGGAGAADAFEQATEAALKQIEALREQAEVIGMTAEETAVFRFEQELLKAAMADGTATEAETQRIAALRAEYVAAQGDLAALKAEQEAAEARQDRIAEAFGSVLDGIMAMVRGTETALDLLIKAVDNVAKRLAEMAKTQFRAEKFGGAALGFIGSIIFSFIGRILEARREMQRAQEAWAGMQDDIAAFAAELRGTAGGDLSSALADVRSRIEAFAEAAAKAGAPIDDLQKMMTDFAVRAVGEFQRNFGLMIHGLRSGLGTNSPAVEAAANVAAIGKELAAFVEDTRLATEMTGSGNKGLNAAIAAAQGYALSLLGTAPELSDVQTEFLRIMGTAQALRGVLVDLGMSADEAAAAIDKRVNKALQALRKDFAQDLEARLNVALGKGYINDVGALLDEAGSLLADAQLLGISESKVLKTITAEVQALIDGAGLTGEAFDELITQFPELAGAVHEAVSAIEEEMSRINQVAGDIVGYVNNLLTGSGSTLSPTDRLAAAQATFGSQLALAQGGNLDAQANITKHADDLLTAARAMFASGPEFQAIFDQITEQLLALPAVQQTDDPVVIALRDTTAQLLGVQQDQIAATGQVAAHTALVKVTADKLGKTTETINTNLATEYWSPMVKSLTAIEEYTRITANTKEIKHPILHKLFPKLFSAEGGLIPAGLVDGGIVGNGVWNRDSVLAQYAGGGSIALAGGEYVMPAPAVNANTLPMLESMRRGGAVNDNRRELLQLTRVTADIGAAQIREMRTGFSTLAQRIDALETRTRIEASREPRRAANR